MRRMWSSLVARSNPTVKRSVTSPTAEAARGHQPAAPQRRRLPPRLLNGDLVNDHPTPLDGTCSARFDPVRELFAAKLESGEDLGASVAVNIHGEMVVDLWGGWADEARTAPWAEDTIA